MDGQEKGPEPEVIEKVSATSSRVVDEQGRTDVGKSSKTMMGTSFTSESLYPSSYSTAEEDGNLSPNGIVPTSKALAAGENVSASQLQAHIFHLEDLLAVKEAALLAVTQELDAVREMSCIDASIGPLASGVVFDVDFKASIAEYNRKLQEHASALCQRDEMIKKLADTLKQSVQDREELKTEAEHLTEQVHTLQSQLQAVGKHVQQPQTKLLDALKEKDVQLQKKSAELSNCKAQSSKEVQFLMSSLEELQQRAARSASASPPAVSSKDELNIKLARELKELRLQYASDKNQWTDKLSEARKTEALLRGQVVTAQKECEKLNLDISSLKLAHETHLSVCRHESEGLLLSQRAHEEQLNQNLEEATQKITELVHDVQSLRSQLSEKSMQCRTQADRIQLLQNQAQEYSTDISTCHQTLEQYKRQIDELQVTCSKDLAQKDANHRAEVALLNGRIAELQESHSRQVHNMHQDLNRMKQRQMEELGMMQLSHENEVNTSKRDAERCRTELREKNNLLAIQEQQLDEEKQWSRTYSQQVQELGKKLNEEEYKNEEYRGKIESLEHQLQEINQACTLYQPQIEFLNQQLKDERQKSTNIMQQLEDVRKQLVLEQERCKACSASMETANSNIRDLQRMNAEIKLQASKLDQSAQQKIKNEQQKNISLQGEIVTLSEQLKQERNAIVSYKCEIEALNQQAMGYSSLEKAFEDVQRLLENEKLAVSSCNCEIEMLNKQLKDQNAEYEENCRKMNLKIEECQSYIKQNDELKKQLLAAQQSHLEQKWDLEQQINELTNSVENCTCRVIPGVLTEHFPDERNQELSPQQILCEKYVEQVKSLELKLKVLSETNMQLKKEREQAEIELCEIKELYATSKTEFERFSCELRKEISVKEEDIVKLQKQCDEMALQRKEINAYNKQINELISAKVLLENKLLSLQEEHSKEIKVLRDQVEHLESQMKVCNQIVNEDAIDLLVKKCHDDIQCLRSLCMPNNLSKDSVDKVDGSRQLSDEQSFSKSYISGLLSIEKLLKLCEDFCREDPKGPRASAYLVGEISKSLFTTEKLQLELENRNEQIHTLKLDYAEMSSRNGKLSEQIKHLELRVKSLQDWTPQTYLPSETEESNGCGTKSLPSSRISNVVSCWIKQCEDLNKTNVQLKSDVFDLQAKLTEAERKISLSTRFEKKTVSDLCDLSCSCENKFKEERDLLKHAIDGLQKEIVDKELHHEEKIKSILKKSKSLNQWDSNCDDNFVNLINDFSCKAKEIIILQDDLRRTQRKNEMYKYKNTMQANELKKINAALNESWQMCHSLEGDLHNALKENSIFRARLMRLETFYESVKKEKTAPDDLLWKVIEELSVTDNELGPTASSEDNRSKSAIVEKIETVMKIIKRMNTDCESLLVKVQKENKAAISGYLQSEALGLRRLQAALLEMEQTILSKTGPALQLHVDLLNQQLEEKQIIYEDICEAHYSLEAEMREMEERFQQQEEHLQDQLRQHKASVRYWQLKAQNFEVQLSSLQVAEHHDDVDLKNILTEVDSIYSQALNSLHHEVDRVSLLRESKVKVQMAEKLLALEKNHKQQFDNLGEHIKEEHNVRALQVIHQQEMDAVRAECDYARLKDIHRLYEQLPSSLHHPCLDSSCNKLSTLLMRHNLSRQYNASLRKISVTLQNELAKELSRFEEKLDNASSSSDIDFDLALGKSKDETSLNVLEQLLSKSKELAEKLVEMQSADLQSILSVCEEHHELIMDKFKKMIGEFDTLCDVKNMQEELSRVKEEHKLAFESISASHRAEVSRLRMLSHHNVTETSETNEAALSVLRRELEEKHKRQMEELRTYFEQKCADFEKHYSEEVFSQHSRKLSDCSSASESELVSEMYYAGPGSSNSGAGAPSHFCDLLGESSFKELQDPILPVNLEKLLVENREQIEAMRLALESRHQGELEAQKELYETRVEELLSNMNESHAAELKLQCKRLQEMEEVETELNNKIREIQSEVASLKDQLSKCSKGTAGDDPPANRSQLELEAELERMANTLKKKDSESSAQIVALKVKLRENHEVMSKLEKDMSNLRSKYNSDTESLTSCINEKIEQIKELKQKTEELSLRLEENDSLLESVKLELNNKCMKLKEDYESLLEEKNEEFKCSMNKLQSELQEKYATDIQMKEFQYEQILNEKVSDSIKGSRKQLETEYAEYLEFVKKCADDTKAQLIQQHQNELKQIADKHEMEMLELKKSSTDTFESRQQPVNLEGAKIDALTNECLFKESSLSSCLKELLQLSGELHVNHQEKLEKIIMKLCQEEAIYQDKLHQDLELRLESVQKECERRFHLQLEEARADIVQALEQQIQQLLDDNTDVMDKPIELQQLEKKFASKYQEKLSNMQKEHEAKISDLLAKHAAQISAARDKKQNINNVAITAEDLEKLYKERDCLRNVAATLRDVVAELVRYFMSWEDDFNSTLMDELVKLEAAQDSDALCITHQEDSIILEESQNVSHRDSTPSDEEMPVIVATPARRRQSSCLKRVHFAPDVSGILSLLDDGSLLENVGLNYSIRDASLNFQEELDRCLARLRSDSAALYALSKPSLSTVPSRHQTISIEETPGERLSKKLSNALEHVTLLQKENEELQHELNALREEQEKSFSELQATRLRLESLEEEARQRAEVVAEGYGEGEQSISCDVPSSPCATNVEELQNKARSLLLGASNTVEESGVVSPNTSQHLPHVVEELCRNWERLAEESRHKHDDLQQQVEAADKQLRATRTFMDEQAAEREQERDEFVHEIKRLQDLLRDKDRDRNSHHLMNHEVEALEIQLKEVQSALKDTQEKLDNLNAEHKQAVDKIWTLRDIISDLEIQVASKAEEAAAISAQNKTLHQMVEQQGRTHLELAQEMEELQLCSSNGRLAEQITQLEEQLRKHQMLSEQFGDPGAIEQMKIQLHDLGASLDLHTRELECANACSTLPASPCLSSHSEDVSIRETLEAARAAAEKKEASHSSDPCFTLPFSDVSLIMEQWQRHARADDAALKKIRDLEMQLDDIQAEKDALGTRLQDQMQLSSSLQSKLDEYRRKADVKHSQVTANMHRQMEDMQTEIHNYVETLEAREKQIESLRSSLHQVENELRVRDADIRKRTETERSIASKLQSQVSKLSADKEELQAMLSQKDAMHVSLPSLMESMLLDKNADIDRLEKQVQHLTKQVELSSHYVATPSTTLEFEYCESEKVRAHVELSPVLELRRSVNLPTIDESIYVKSDIGPNDTPASFGAQRMSLENNGPEMLPEIEVSLKPVPLEETVQNLSNNSTIDTHSDSMDTFNTSSLSSCERRVETLEKELELKNKIVASYLQEINEKTATISELEKTCKQLEGCDRKLTEMSKETNEVKVEKANLQQRLDHLQRMCYEKDLELKKLTDELSAGQTEAKTKASDQQTKSDLSVEKNSELEAKESEIMRLKDEVGATQSILANLQRKVQEAKQIARSPSRPSPENNQALRLVQNELEAAKQEIVELKDLCKSIKSEVETECQRKQAEFEMVLNGEQLAKKSLLETLQKIQEENKKMNLISLEEELKKIKDKLEEKNIANISLQSELNQLNMECATLKQQLSTPIREVSNLACKLDSEKKFADALKEELMLYKSKSASLDEDCQSLREKIRSLEGALNTASKPDQINSEKRQLLKEVAELKALEDLLQEELSNLKTSLDNLSHENAVLREENADVGKELSDMKQIIVQMRADMISRDEAQKNLNSTIKELNDMEYQRNEFVKVLSSLRHALKNIQGNIHDLPGLAAEDCSTLHELQQKFHLFSQRGGGDGPWNKLSITETDIHEIRPIEPPLTESESLDDLTDLVQHELDVSVQLDDSLLQTIDPCTSNKIPADGLPKKNIASKEEPGERKDKIYQLESELSQMRASVQLLHSQLETERAQYYKLQQQDSNLIEEMRVKLTKALDGQAALHMQLQSEISRQRTSVGDSKGKHESVASCKTTFGQLTVDRSSDKLQKELIEAKSDIFKLKAEKDTTEKQLRRLQEVEIQRSRRRAVIEEKHRRQIDQLQALQAETQQECIRLRQELLTVNQKLQLAQEEFAKDQDTQLKNHTPVVERLKNMNAFFEEHIEENMRMAKQMEDLTDEHKKLRHRIAQLEGQLADKRSNDSFEAANARFAAERSEWEAEHKMLLLALNDAKQKKMLSSDSDVEERISHLFGRYLRMQSYRKALMWQKRYLLSVITGLNESKHLAASHLASLGGNVKEKQHNPRRKFRSAVMVMMAVHRMRFMVERWLRGKRIGCGVVVQQTLSHSTYSTGQQSFFPTSHIYVSSEEARSGLSQSPPTLERPRQPRSQPSVSAQFPRLSLSSRGLGTTNTLSECVTNFHLVKQRFDALLSNPPK